MAYSYLSDMDDHTDNWTVKVRVCRRWESVNTNDGSLISLDMILIDEKQTLMHASVHKHLVPRYEECVSEGKVYCLRNLKVTTNTFPYRPLASDLKLLFLATTRVLPLEDNDVNIPKYGFEFVTQPVLHSRANNPTVLSGRLSFVTTSASKIYVNPEVEHVSSVRERFSTLSIQAKAIEGTSTARMTPEEEMFLNRMTVKALVDATCAGELQVSVVTLKATISDINTSRGWYYIACRSCVTKADFKDGVYACDNCGTLDYPLALFHLRAEVQYGTGTTTLVMFNYPAENLLNTSAKKLVGKMQPGDETAPRELKKLIGNELIFKLRLDRYNLIEGLQNYTVSTVFNPVEELEAAYAKKEAGKESAGPSGAPPGTDNVVATDNKRKRKLSSGGDTSQDHSESE